MNNQNLEDNNIQEIQITDCEVNQGASLLPQVGEAPNLQDISNKKKLESIKNQRGVQSFIPKQNSELKNSIQPFSVSNEKIEKIEIQNEQPSKSSKRKLMKVLQKKKYADAFSKPKQELRILPFLQRMANIQAIRHNSTHRVALFETAPEQTLEVNQDFVLRKSSTIHSPPSYYKIIKSLRVSLFVKRFMTIIKTYSTYLNFRQIQEKQFDIINDQSSFFQYYENQNYFNKFEMSMRNRIDRFFNNLLKPYRQKNNQNIRDQNVFFTPTSVGKIVFDFFLLFFLLLQIIRIPLQIGFEIIQDDFNDEQQFNLDDISVIIFFIDIFIMKINTATYVKGQIIENRYNVIFEYVKGRFLFDIILTLSLILAKTFDQQFLKLIFVLKIIDVAKIYNDLEDIFQFKDKLAAWSRLMQLIISILLAAHFIACAWHKIALSEFNKGMLPSEIWIGTSIYSELLDRYVISMYWTIITMVTVGYGDIRPINTNEMIFVIAIAIVSSVIFAYSMNQIGDILKELSRSDQNFRHQILTLNIYMDKRNVNNTLKMKVRKYFEYLNIEKNENDESGQELVNNNLALSLKHEVLKDIYGSILRSKKFFQLNFSNQFIDELALRMKEQTLGPEEIIYKKGEIGDKIYFIIKGEVDKYLSLDQKENQNLRITALGKGQSFGGYNFFQEGYRQLSVRTINVTTLTYLQLQDFKEVIQNFPDDFEKFKLIQHNINIMNTRKGLDFQCQSCDKYDHDIQMCPYITSQINKAKVHQIVIKINNMKQTRENIHRKVYKAKNSIFLQPIYNKNSAKFLIDQENEAQRQLEIDDDNHYSMSEKKGKSDLSLSSSSHSSEELSEISQGINNKKQKILQQTKHLSSQNLESMHKSMKPKNIKKINFQKDTNFKRLDSQKLNKLDQNPAIKVEQIENNKEPIEEKHDLNLQNKLVIEDDFMHGFMEISKNLQLPVTSELQVITIPVKENNTGYNQNDINYSRQDVVAPSSDNFNLEKNNKEQSDLIQNFSDQLQITEFNKPINKQNLNITLQAPQQPYSPYLGDSSKQSNIKWIDKIKQVDNIQQSSLYQILQRDEDFDQYFKHQTNTNIKEQPQDIWLGFERPKQFVYFLPRNNYLQVINRLNKYLNKTAIFKIMKKNKKNIIKKIRKSFNQQQTILNVK